MSANGPKSAARDGERTETQTSPAKGLMSLLPGKTLSAGMCDALVIL
jgi:hypothetical protein